MSFLRFAFRAVAVVCLLASVLPAQDKPTLHQAPSAPSPDTPSIHVDVREVTLPVTVRDKHGKLVQNLGKDDFVLEQDGKSQTISNIRRDSSLPLTLGLLVDTSMSMRNELSAEKSASEKFLDQMLSQSQDQAFIIHFDHEVELLQDLTSSRDKLYKALGLLEAAQPQDRGQDTRGGGDDRGQGQPRMRHRGGTQLYDAIYLAANEILKKQQGRKAIVLLTDGQDRGSKETLADAVEAAQRADTMVYAIYLKGEEMNRGFGNERGRGGMGSPRIGFPGGGGGYPGGYPGGGGGRRGGEREEPRVDGKKILTEIASKTGGQMFEATKKETVDEIYTQIAEELRTQLILAYTPDKTSADPGYHRVTLNAKNKDYKVQTREGYYIQEQTTAAK
jgi:VWFA-related protein